MWLWLRNLHDSLGHQDVEILKEKPDLLMAYVRGYSIYVDYNDRFILHDCRDWRRGLGWFISVIVESEVQPVVSWRRWSSGRCKKRHLSRNVPLLDRLGHVRFRQSISEYTFLLNTAVPGRIDFSFENLNIEGDGPSIQECPCERAYSIQRYTAIQYYTFDFLAYNAIISIPIIKNIFR